METASLFIQKVDVVLYSGTVSHVTMSDVEKLRVGVRILIKGKIY